MRPKYIHPASVFTSDKKEQQQHHRKKTKAPTNTNQTKNVWQNKGQPQKLICSSPRTWCPLTTEPQIRSRRIISKNMTKTSSVSPLSSMSSLPRARIPQCLPELFATTSIRDGYDTVCVPWVSFSPPQPHSGFSGPVLATNFPFSCLAGTKQMSRWRRRRLHILRAIWPDSPFS